MKQKRKKKDVCYLNFVPGCDSNFDKCTVTMDQSNSDQLHTHGYVIHTSIHTDDIDNSKHTNTRCRHLHVHTPSSSVSVCDWLVLVFLSSSLTNELEAAAPPSSPQPVSQLSLM